MRWIIPDGNETRICLALTCTNLTGQMWYRQKVKPKCYRLDSGSTPDCSTMEITMKEMWIMFMLVYVVLMGVFAFCIWP